MEMTAALGFSLVGIALIVLVGLVIVSKKTIDRIHREQIGSVRDFFKENDDES